ncbi:VOC family protein [Streptomyces gamaensis]|uniref:VOC family protein n=1 Tax=Streptomyces gamaensis TaxID=1763542 RepID=A0ABW0YYJ4_9ACTN
MLSTDFMTGSPNWIDLGSPDTAASAAFYAEVLGWDVQSAGPDAGGYGLFRKDGKSVAGIGPLTEENASPAWTVYFQSPDADATAKAVEQGGGRVRRAPFDVMNAGRMGQFTDPGGADFAIWQPAAVKGLELASEPGALFWAELHTGDPAAAHAFYRGLFGWRSLEVEIPGMTYTVLSTAEGSQEDASFGGVVPLREDAEETRWMPYLLVEDADTVAARVRECGGTVLVPPEDIPQVGRIAWFADPFGAAFAVIRPQG